MLRCRASCTSSAQVVARLYLHTTQTHHIQHDPTEQEREKQLRDMVLQKYRGMRSPAATHHTYGNFASTGAFASSMGNDGRADASSTSSSCEGNGRCDMGGQGRGRPDLFMLFTGAALMYVSGKILFMRARRDVSEVDTPLWVASPELQAKHFIYCAQFTPKVRDEIRHSFQAVRENNPFVNFYAWLPSQQPYFGVGQRHSFSEAMNSIVAALVRGDQLSYIALGYAFRNALAQRDSDPRNRLDGFVDSLQSGTGLSHYVSPAASATSSSPPLYYGASPAASMSHVPPGPTSYMPAHMQDPINPYLSPQYPGTTHAHASPSSNSNSTNNDVAGGLEYALNTPPNEAHASVPFTSDNNSVATNDYRK